MELYKCFYYYYEPKSLYARFWLVGSGKPTVVALRATVGLRRPSAWPSARSLDPPSIEAVGVAPQIHSPPLIYRLLCLFSALKLLVGRPACKNWLMRCWRGYLSGTRWKWLTYDPDDATDTPASLASVQPRMVLSFCGRLAQVVIKEH